MLALKVEEYMQALLLRSPGNFKVESIDEPICRPHETLVRVHSVGVCGSDFPRMFSKGAHCMPIVCGHEFSGTLVADEAKAQKQKCTVAPLIPCNSCIQCKAGHFSRCNNYDYFGSRRNGAFSEFVAVPKSNLVEIPLSLDLRAAAMVDPASIALHAIWKIKNFKTGMTAAVVGCGPIGLFAIQWLKILGVSQVYALDIKGHNLKLAEIAGADFHYKPHEKEYIKNKVDLVVDAAGNSKSLETAILMSKPGASISLLGIPTSNVHIENKVHQKILRNELSIFGAWNSFGNPFPGKQWFETIKSLANGELKWEFMISHELNLNELSDLLNRIKLDADIKYSKILVRL